MALLSLPGRVLKHCFFITHQVLLRNEIEALDFTNAEKARTTINNWVELKTQKKIR